jgi:hypothetical protein
LGDISSRPVFYEDPGKDKEPRLKYEDSIEIDFARIDKLHMPTDPGRMHTDGYLTDGAKDDTDQDGMRNFLEIERSDSHGEGVEKRKWLGRRKVGEPRPLSESEVLP